MDSPELLDRALERRIRMETPELLLHLGSSLEAERHLLLRSEGDVLLFSGDGVHLLVAVVVDPADHGDGHGEQKTA